MKFQEMPCLLHGGDYNADQWLDRPDILREDIRLMKEAHVNVVTLGVFSWSSYEPREGEYTFEWLDQIMDSLYENGIYVILATPSAAKPPWMGKKYPEVMRTDSNRVRHLYGERENQCNSSPVFREKLEKLDLLLGERYAHHPALLMWHISNEMYGECHCPLCQKKFQEWLQKRYGTIDRLNEQYWSNFWSHRYSDWSELESPAGHGETAMHALRLDHRRFYSEVSIDLLKMEIQAVRKFNPEIPVTHNMFHLNCGYNFKELADCLDVISWDEYPRWHQGSSKTSEWEQAVSASFDYDFSRSLKKAPFLLMESTPSTTNWFPTSKLKRPGMHLLSSMEAVASGADSVQYFQWRKSRGGVEKFHGAVVSHSGRSDTRVFADVKELGGRLEEYSFLKGSGVKSEVAVIYDWANIGALEEQQNLRRSEKEFMLILKEHYEALLKNYVSVDIIGQEDDFSAYKIVIAPMLYLFQDSTPAKIRAYIEGGGTFVLTYYSGLVNENDLVYECDPPYGLNDVFGIRSEEMDCLMADESNRFTYGGRQYRGYYYCDLIHAEQAEVLSVYEQDFYQGRPVLTRNAYGEGFGYYLACRTDTEFLKDFYARLIAEEGVHRVSEHEFVQDVMIKEREKDGTRYRFYLNFSTEPRCVGQLELPPYGFHLEICEN